MCSPPQPYIGQSLPLFFPPLHACPPRLTPSKVWSTPALPLHPHESRYPLPRSRIISSLSHAQHTLHIRLHLHLHRAGRPGKRCSTCRKPPHQLQRASRAHLTRICLASHDPQAPPRPSPQRTLPHFRKPHHQQRRSLTRDRCSRRRTNVSVPRPRRRHRRRISSSR